MKRTMVLLFLATTAVQHAPVCAAEPVFPPGYPRERYVDQAAQELRQIRIQVDTTARRAPLAAQPKFGIVYDALAEAEQALGELRSSEESELAQRRVQFEQAKAKALRTWREFKLPPESEPPKG